MFMFADLDAKCNQIKHYKLALSNVDLSNTSHFPHKIPNEAKNAELKASTYSFFGSEDLYLKFDTNKEYIDKELKNSGQIKLVLPEVGTLELASTYRNKKIKPLFAKMKNYMVGLTAKVIELSREAEEWRNKYQQ